jgi:hypothetical protein
MTENLVWRKGVSFKPSTNDKITGVVTIVYVNIFFFINYKTDTIGETMFNVGFIYFFLITSFFIDWY